jgi:hypothetical protein
VISFNIFKTHSKLENIFGSFGGGGKSGNSTLGKLGKSGNSGISYIGNNGIFGISNFQLNHADGRIN